MSSSDPVGNQGGAAAPAAVALLRPDLPPLADLLPDLQTIWDSGLLSNGGPFHRRFEAALSERLDGAPVCLVANATLGLMLALKALAPPNGARCEVITTPFTFVATANAARWAGLTPVFADVDPHSLNLDPAAVERAITPRTLAILPVHCYGRPCDVDALEQLAEQRGLALVYDAAHAFGVQLQGRSLLARGQASVLSFHATKVFNTLEGGAVVCNHPGLKQRLDQLANHGLDGGGLAIEAGLNAKMHEISAALGWHQLGRVDQALGLRAVVASAYRQGLAGVAGLRCLPEQPGVMPNHAYFPVLVEPDYPLSRDQLSARLGAQGIQTRRYFYPLACDMPAHADLPQLALPVARRLAEQVLCLPMHPGLQDQAQQRILQLLACPQQR